MKKYLIKKANVEIDTTDYLSILDKVDDAIDVLWDKSKFIYEQSDKLDELPKAFFDEMKAHNNTVEANFYTLSGELRKYIDKIDKLSKNIRKSIEVK